MTVDYTKLALLAHANGKRLYHYDGAAAGDTVAQVSANGYFNNRTGVQNLTAKDIILATCTDGDVQLRVASVTGNTASASSGRVDTVMTGGGDGGWNGVIGSASVATIALGITELGTGTATAHSIAAAPRIGDKITLIQTGTATGGISVITSSAGVTVDAAGDRTLNFTGKGQNATLLGVSTTRWVVMSGNFSSISA